MGYYSNAGQNIASTEITDIAKIGGAVAGLVHASNVASAKTDIQLADQVKGLGEEEVKIAETEHDLETQGKELPKQEEKIKSREDQLNQIVGLQQNLKEKGFQDPEIDRSINELKGQVSEDRQMYDKAMDEMQKKAKILDIQKKNFETRKKLIESAIERSGK